MKWIIFILLIPLVFENCNSREKGIIYKASINYYDDGNINNGLCFLTLLTDKKMYGYKKEYEIKLPEKLDGKKLIWGSTYFTGLKKNRTGNTIYFIILNYDTTNTKIIFDKNGNADFSDDSSMNISAGTWFDVVIQNEKDRKGLGINSFLYTKNISDSNYKKLHKTMAGKWPGVLPYNYVLLDRRKNFRKIYLPDSNTVSLYDYDCDGFFNGKKDKIIAGDVQENDGITMNPVKTKNVQPGVDLPFSGNTYRLVGVDKYGNNVELISLNKTTDTTENLPDFKFLNELRDKKSFAVTGSAKFTVLYVWGLWCIGCREQAPFLVKLINENAGKVDFYTFNIGDEEEKMKQYLAATKYPFQSYRVDTKNVEKLQVDGFPSYIVIDSNKKIVLRTSSVIDLEGFLQKEQ